MDPGSGQPRTVVCLPSTGSSSFHLGAKVRESLAGRATRERLAASQTGNLVNLSEWASILGISRDTVASYLEILEARHVVAMVPPYAGGRRSELTKMPKVFFIDNGIRNHLVHNFAPPAARVDSGPTVENWVFGELLKSLPLEVDVHFWRTTSRAEVSWITLDEVA